MQKYCYNTTEKDLSMCLANVNCRSLKHVVWLFEQSYQPSLMNFVSANCRTDPKQTNFLLFNLKS